MPAYAIANLQEADPHHQEIAPLRSRRVEGDIILIEGVPEGYDPTSLAQTMREALPAVLHFQARA